MGTQEEANIEETRARAELSRAHARLMNAQAEALEKKNRGEYPQGERLSAECRGALVRVVTLNAQRPPA